MRIATLVVGLVFSIWMFFEAFLVAVFTSSSDEEGAAVGFGLLAAIIGIVSAALAVPLPLVATIGFVFATASSALAGATGYPNHQVYAFLLFFVAVLSFFGWRAKRKEAAQQHERDRREQERDELLVRALQGQMQPATVTDAATSRSRPTSGQTITCPRCGTSGLPTSIRFCPNCGLQRTEEPTER